MPDPFSFTIQYLADHPQHIPIIAQWFYDEWVGPAEGWTYEQVEESVRSNDCFKDRMNVTYIALNQHNKPIGVVQLLDTIRLPGWDDATPWLDGLYVTQKYRHTGVAYALARRMLNKAEEMGFKELYAASAQMQTVLRNHHFGKIGQAQYGSQPITIYRKKLVTIEGLTN